jgi:aerobic carbon-monoxide dehydrogenase small subunit
MTTMEVELHVNGVEHRVEVEPRTTLADALRDKLALTGTHLGCEHGVCGACTVLLDGRPVRACLLFAVQCRGLEITTIEGLADHDQLHPIQRAFIDNFGLQCGFCTPGFIMLAAGVLNEDPYIGDDELVEQLSANLCRCTGYRNITASVKQGAQEMRTARHTTGAT